MPEKLQKSYHRIEATKLESNLCTLIINNNFWKLGYKIATKKLNMTTKIKQKLTENGKKDPLTTYHPLE